MSLVVDAQTPPRDQSAPVTRQVPVRVIKQQIKQHQKTNLCIDAVGQRNSANKDFNPNSGGVLFARCFEHRYAQLEPILRCHCRHNLESVLRGRDNTNHNIHYTKLLHECDMKRPWFKRIDNTEPKLDPHWLKTMEMRVLHHTLPHERIVHNECPVQASRAHFTMTRLKPTASTIKRKKSRPACRTRAQASDNRHHAEATHKTERHDSQNSLHIDVDCAFV